MFKNKSSQVVMCFSTLILLIAILLVSPINAQSISYGCSVFPTIDMVPATSVHGYTDFLLFAGEVIVITYIGTASEVVVNGVVTLALGESYTFVVPIDGLYTFRISNFTGSGWVDTTVDCNPATTPPADSNGITLPDNHCPVFHDGRINNCDTFNPVVLYGRPDNEDNWRLEVYNADRSGLLFAVPSDVINAVERCPASNTLIYEDEATSISFWNLAERPDSTCPYQLNAPMNEAGKWYIIVFDELYPNTYYKSWTEFIEHQVQVPSNEIAWVNPADDEAADVLCRFLALADDC